MERRVEQLLANLDLSDLGDLADDLGLDGYAGDTAVSMVLALGLDDPDLLGAVSDRAVDWAADNAADLVSSIDESTRNMLRDIITEGLDRSWTEDDMAATIEGAAAFDEDRAQLIAATEVANANGQATLIGLQDASESTGLTIRKVWILGPNPCEVCEGNAAAGAIPLDDDFPSGDDAPLAHPRCVCDLESEVEEPEDDDTVEQLAKDFNEDEPRDERGRWTSGGDPLPTMVGSKEEQVAILRANWATDGAEKQLEDIPNKVWRKEEAAWDAAHPDDIVSATPQNPEARIPAGHPFLLHMESKYTDNQMTPFPGARAANEYFSERGDWHLMAFVDGKVPSWAREYIRDVTTHNEDDDEEIENVAKRGKNVTPQQANYVDLSPYLDTHCSICAMFRRQGSKFLGNCTLVKDAEWTGPSINPRGWCRFFEEK